MTLRAVFDPSTGGGFDGLEREGVNRNQGAESTLALVATMAQAARLSNAPRVTFGRPARRLSGVE